MVTHDNIVFIATTVFRAMQSERVLGNQAVGERILSYLPLSHVAGMMVDIILPLVISANGPAWGTAHFARNYDLKIGTIGDRLRAVR